MATQLSVLVATADPRLTAHIEAALAGESREFHLAKDADEALRAASRQAFDVALLDVSLPTRPGVDLLGELGASPIGPQIVALGSDSTVEDAVETMKKGAFDFLRLPIDPPTLQRAVRRAGERRRLARENAVLRRTATLHPFTGPVVSASPKIQEVLRKLETVASSRAAVLLTGETGTGKGLMAKTLHRLSGREPFLQVNCGALQESLFESELFGHRRGAFTGASESKPGLFEVADGGTLFLDEVGELKPVMQAKLLQVLDTGEIRQVGANTARAVDVRIVAATNADLEAEVLEGRFRRDLFFRLHVVRIAMPALRERREDIPLLLDYYLQRFHVPGAPTKRFTPQAMSLLTDYGWPGNVRELANLVETSMLLSPSNEITLADLPSNVMPAEGPPAPIGDDAPMSLAEAEKRHILATIRHTGGLKAKAARLLGVDIKTLNRKLRGYAAAARHRA